MSDIDWLNADAELTGIHLQQVLGVSGRCAWIATVRETHPGAHARKERVGGSMEPRQWTTSAPTIDEALAALRKSFHRATREDLGRPQRIGAPA